MKVVKIFRSVLLIALMPGTMATSLWAQNAVEMRQYELLKVSRSVAIESNSMVRVQGGRLQAVPGFKFVQIREHQVFVLVPEDHNQLIVDFHSLMQLQKINGNEPALRLYCGRGCQIRRVSRSSVECLSSCSDRWQHAPVSSSAAVIIPAYHLQGR